MKKFQFTLQTLYNVKSTEETQTRNVLSGLMRERNELNAHITDIDKRYDQHHKSYQEACKKGISGSKLKEYGTYFEYLAAERKRLVTLLNVCENKIAQTQQALLKLINEKKVLDRIREEQFAEYQKEVRKDEDKALEDFISGHRG